MNRMNRSIQYTKMFNYDSGTVSPEFLQPSVSPINRNLTSFNGDVEFNVVKLESMSPQPPKRRRSYSHTGMESTNGNCSNTPHNIPSFHSEQKYNGNTPVFINNKWIKEKHKKETHNRVERKRRDFINAQIKKLADLLPSEVFLNYDLKMNKGIILKNSVDYISSMKYLEEINRQLIHENELGSKLIRNLVAFNDLNYSEPSVKENMDSTCCLKEAEMNSLITDWNSCHRENKELLEEFSKRFLNSYSDNKNKDSDGDVPSFDIQNNEDVISSLPSYKRYSSVPTGISILRNGSKNVPVMNAFEMNSPILNSILKKPDHKKTNGPAQIKSTFNEGNNDAMHYYIESSMDVLTEEDPSTDNSSVMNSQLPNGNDKFFQIQDKIYYILPKCDSGTLSTQAVPNPGGSKITNENDPMLLSDAVNFDSSDR